MAVPEDVELRFGSQQVLPKAVGTGAVNEDVEGQLIAVAGAVSQPSVLQRGVLIP